MIHNKTKYFKYKICKLLTYLYAFVYMNIYTIYLYNYDDPPHRSPQAQVS